ncbi:ketoacyl-ACP synthase III [Paenibacillus sp. HJGM_3]|uniref:ketoacyl-ACP synthase III n=1 Tax=Paenibacillus sp. HJGM_3 TaxID=3379816 RepID=UPI00385D354B
MSNPARARITAIGTYVPEKVLTNADLEQMVDTNDEWIVTRTGIRERRISAPDEYTSDLCVAAARNLMQRYDKSLDDVDMILVATTTPDFSFPSTAALVQHRLNIPTTAGAMDLSAACAGFVYALHMAHSFILSGLHRKILVFGAETLTKITDYTDRSTCVLFGDGAGAVLVEADEERDRFLAYRLMSDGGKGQHIYLNATPDRRINELTLTDTGYIVQNGREVFKWAVRTLPEEIRQLLNDDSEGLTESKVDWFIPHSANLRMIEPVCEKLGFPLDRTLYSLVQNGNTSAASIPLALDRGVRDGRVKSGDRLLLYGFGAGLVQAGQLLEWTLEK